MSTSATRFGTMVGTSGYHFDRLPPELEQFSRMKLAGQPEFGLPWGWILDSEYGFVLISRKPEQFTPTVIGIPHPLAGKDWPDIAGIIKPWIEQLTDASVDSYPQVAPGRTLPRRPDLSYVRGYHLAVIREDPALRCYGPIVMRVLPAWFVA